MEKRNWTNEETNYFVCLLEEMVADGQKADARQLKPAAWEKLSIRMKEKFPLVDFTVKHCKNKHKRLKEKYQTAADMLACSGFGWNEEKQIIEVDSKQVLEIWAKQHPRRFYTPGKLFPLFCRLEVIFGKDRANGGYSVDSGDANAFMQHHPEEGNEVGDKCDIFGNSSESQVPYGASMGSTSTMNQRDESSSAKKAKELEVLKSMVDNVKMAVEQQNHQVTVLAKAILGENDAQKLGQTLTALGFVTEEIVVVGLKFSENPNLAKTFWRFEDDQKRAFVRAILYRG